MPRGSGRDRRSEETSCISASRRCDSPSGLVLKPPASRPVFPVKLLKARNFLAWRRLVRSPWLLLITDVPRPVLRAVSRARSHDRFYALGELYLGHPNGAAGWLSLEAGPCAARRWEILRRCTVQPWRS